MVISGIGLDLGAQMVKTVEVVLELKASGFIKSEKVTRARVVRGIPSGILSCEIDDSVNGVLLPQGVYASIDEARAAILDYWVSCDAALESEA